MEGEGVAGEHPTGGKRLRGKQAGGQRRLVDVHEPDVDRVTESLAERAEVKRHRTTEHTADDMAVSGQGAVHRQKVGGDVCPLSSQSPTLVDSTWARPAETADKGIVAGPVDVPRWPGEKIPGTRHGRCQRT